MARKKPVNMTFQIILVLIPIPLLWLIACYRVENLRWAILILALVAIEWWAIETYLNDGGLVSYPSLVDDDYGNIRLYPIWIPVVVAHFIMYVYLIIRWTKQWNERMNMSTSRGAI